MLSDSLSYACLNDLGAVRGGGRGALKEIAEDEKAHAEKLRDRITALGGVPTMELAKEDLIPASSLEEIVEVNVNEEKRAIALGRPSDRCENLLDEAA